MRALVFTALCVACAGAFSAGRPGLHGARRRAAPPAPRARVAEGAALRARPVLSSAAAGSGGENKWYRTLGIAPDATYDEVTDAFTALVEAAGSDEARVELLERARDRILDARLKLRLSGQGQTVREPTRAPKARRDWLAPLRFLGKYVAMPDRRHFSKVTTVFGGFTAIALAGSQLADQMAFFTMVFAPGFIYANGQPEPRKDDNGMVGEILPTKPGPLALSFAMTAVAVGGAYLVGLLYLSILIPPSVLPTKALCNAMMAAGAWLATMFLKAQVD